MKILYSRIRKETFKRFFSHYSSNLNEFQSLPCYNAYHENFTPRVRINAHTVFRTMKEGDLTHRLFNSIMNAVQSFTTRNEDIVLKTTKGGVLKSLFAILIGFKRISIIPALYRVSWKLCISRSYKCTFCIQNDERRRFNTSVIHFNQYWTSYNQSQFKTTKGGVLKHLFALLIEFERISIIPILERVSSKRYISRSYKYTYRSQNDERRRLTHRLSNSIDIERVTFIHT